MSASAASKSYVNAGNLRIEKDTASGNEYKDNSQSEEYCVNNDNNKTLSYEVSNTKNVTSKLPSLIGDCVIRLTHPTCYEPPLYLFPELLPPVPENTAPAMAWDGVADAIDVTNSHWHLANAAELHTNLLDGNGNEDKIDSSNKYASKISSTKECEQKESTSSSSHSKRPRAIESLASLVASNKLLEAGIHARVLRKNNFSAASMIEEIMNVKKRAKLNDDEGAVLMTNHFINLLAWCKLREANHSHRSDEQVHMNASDRQVVASCNEVDEKELESRSNEFERDEQIAVKDRDVQHTLQPSPTPWSDKLLNDSRVAGQFISGCEHNVEERVESLRLLSKLFRRPLKSLISRGLQTGYVVPPGTVNVTNPYITRTPSRTNILAEYNSENGDDNLKHKYGSKVTVNSKTSTMYAKCIEERTQLPFVVIISTSNEYKKTLGQQATITTFTNNSINNTKFNTYHNENHVNSDNVGSKDLDKVHNKINDDNNNNSNATTSGSSISSSNGANPERPVRIIALSKQATNFGRREGVQFGANVHGGPVVIHVGIGEYSNHSMQIAPHHFSLVVRPKNIVKRELEPESESEEVSKPFVIKSEKEVDDNAAGENNEEVNNTMSSPTDKAETFLRERNENNSANKSTSLITNGDNHENLHDEREEEEEEELDSNSGIARYGATTTAEEPDTKLTIKREDEFDSVREYPSSTSLLPERKNGSAEEEHFRSNYNDAGSAKRQDENNTDSRVVHSNVGEININKNTICEDKFNLWLVNYARNGVHVNKREWILVSGKRLERGDDLYVGISSNHIKNKEEGCVHIHVATLEETCKLLNAEKSTDAEFQQSKAVSGSKITSSAKDSSIVKQEMYSDDDDNDLGSYVAGLR